ncbi:MAG: PQQ-binding-like beta-propeller repeat protein, partial [Candidatus Eremiobacteraeota bacterium]|nr:PQQ-binding-like beta-propeller repeat protein [Candidatus Eremiobacteraeota bacterium]
MATLRRFIEVSVCLGIIVAGCCGASADHDRRLAAPAGAEWLQTGWSAELQGLQPFETYLRFGNVPSLAVSWTSPSGGLDTPPVLVGKGGRVLYWGTQGALLAIDPVTGQQLWSAPSYSPTTDGVENPVIDKERIFAACYASAVNGVCAYSTQTGALLWSHDFDPTTNRIS